MVRYMGTDKKPQEAERKLLESVLRVKKSKVYLRERTRVFMKGCAAWSGTAFDTWRDTRNGQEL